MTEKEFIALAQLLVLSVTKVAERVKQAEQKISLEPPQVNVNPTPVSIEAPSVNVEGPEIDMGPLVAAVSGLSFDSVAEQVQAVSAAIVGLAEKEGLDLGPLVEAQGSVGESIGAASERISESHDRLIDAQAKTNSTLVRLADGVEKSASLNQQQFNALFERMGEVIQTMNAPKELMLDEEGNPVGVQTMLRQ